MEESSLSFSFFYFLFGFQRKHKGYWCLDIKYLVFSLFSWSYKKKIYIYDKV